MSPTISLLIERGLEIVAAVLFLLVLAESLRGAKTPSAPASARRQEAASDLELLALAHVEELVRTDPERASSILSRWAEQESLVEPKP